MEGESSHDEKHVLYTDAVLFDWNFLNQETKNEDEIDEHVIDFRTVDDSSSNVIKPRKGNENQMPLDFDNIEEFQKFMEET